MQEPVNIPSVSSEGNSFISENLNLLINEPHLRKSFDNNINNHGKLLLEIFKSQNLKILNGRKTGDFLGKPTFHGFNGLSVVDYIIVSQNLFDITSYFVVKEPTYLSDHSQITAWFSITKALSNFQNNKTNLRDKLKRVPSQYIWETGSKERFQEAFVSVDSSQLITEFLSCDFPSNKLGASTGLSKFENIFITAAKQSLRLKVWKPRFKNDRNILKNKWFDKECNQKRVQLRRLSNAKHRDPLNLSIRMEYHTCLKEYKVLLNHKKDLSQLKTLEQLEKESDSTEFWKILRSANDSVKNAEIPPISEEKWLNHFQTLHTDINMEHKQLDINEKLQNLEKKSDCFNELDFPITLLRESTKN